MLLSPEILQSPEGRRSLAMRKAASQHTLCEFAVASAGSEGQSCFTMAIQSTGESLRPLVGTQVWRTTIKRRNPNGRQAVGCRHSIGETANHGGEKAGT